MPRILCRMGEVCGEGHGISSSHFEEVSSKYIEELDKEMEEMEEMEEEIKRRSWERIE